MLTVKILAIINLMIGYVYATVQSDNGCNCVVTKTATTAPNASASIAAGCSSKIDWNNGMSKWCLVDQTGGPCGNLYNGFGYADTCVNALFPQFTLLPPSYLEWDQTGYTFYTGQTLTVNWTTQNIMSDEWLKLTYIGAGGLRTLTTGSGVNSTAGIFSVRISDSANSLTTNLPVSLTTVTSPSVYVNSPNITVLQSKISSISMYDGNRSITTGTSITSDDRNLTIMWRGLGEAQVGLATVIVKNNGFGSATIGTALSGIPVQSNMSVNYLLPRSFTPGFGSTTYTAQISVQSPGTGVAPYTLSSSSFTIVVAPTPTRTATPSITVTPTPTPSLSMGSTPSQTPTISVTSTPTISVSGSVSASMTESPSFSPTISITASSTRTPAASLDLAAVAAAATAAANANTASIVGGIVGTIGTIAVAFILYKVYERRQIHFRRIQRMNATKDRGGIQNTRAIYGVHEETTPSGTILYQVSMPQQTHSNRNMNMYASRRGRGV